MICLGLKTIFFIVLGSSSLHQVINGQPAEQPSEVSLTITSREFNSKTTLFCRVPGPLVIGHQSLQLSLLHGSVTVNTTSFNESRDTSAIVRYMIPKLNCSFTGNYVCKLTGENVAITSNITVITFNKKCRSDVMTTASSIYTPFSAASNTTPSTSITGQTLEIDWWYYILFGCLGLVLVATVIGIAIICLKTRRHRRRKRSESENYLTPMERKGMMSDKNKPGINCTGKVYLPHDSMVGISSTKSAGKSDGYVNVTVPKDDEITSQSYDNVSPQKEVYGNIGTFQAHTNTISQHSIAYLPQAIYDNSDIASFETADAKSNRNAVYDDVALEELLYDDVPNDKYDEVPDDIY